MMSRFFVLSLCVLATCSAFDVTIKMDDDGFHPANLTLTNVKPEDAIIWVWRFDAFRNLDLKQAATYEDWLACNATGTEFGTSEYKYDTYNFTFNATNDYPRNIYFFTDKLCQKIGMRGMIVVERTDVQTTGIQTTGIQTTEVQTTGIQTTEVKTTGIQTTGVQTTGIHTTGVIVTTGIQTTGVQTTGVQTTEVQTTGVQTTGVQTTEVHTTGVQTTGVQTTDVHTTGIPTTTVSNVTTGIQTTGIQTTGIQTTDVQTTRFNNMTTGIQTTGIQTTDIQTTGLQTTGAVPANATTTGDSSVISACKMIVVACVVIAAML